MSQTTKFIAVLRNKRLSTSPSLRYFNTNSNISSHPAGQLNKPNDSKPHPPRFRLLAHGCRSFYSQTAGAASTGGLDRRVFAPYTVFKGKAALSISPVLPTFRKLDSGGHQLDRRGVIMMKFWPAIGERKYDWDKRQMFALSATEVGSLLSLGPQDSCEFFHDPSMKTSNAGQVRKSLSIKANADSSGYFFSLSVSNNITKATERLTVPLTTAEFAVIRAASGYALPHILGWNHVTNQPLAGASDPATAAPRVKDLEWDR